MSDFLVIEDNEKLWAAEDELLRVEVIISYGDLRCLQFFLDDPQQWSEDILDVVESLVSQFRAFSRAREIESGLDVGVRK